MGEDHWGYKEVGYKYKTGERVITATELDLFSDISGIKVEMMFPSDKAAQAFGDNRRIVPGVYLMSIVLGMLAAEGLVVQGYYLGNNNCKFNAPVGPDDKLHVEGELLNKRVTSKGDRAIVTYSWLLKNQEAVVVAQGENT